MTTDAVETGAATTQAGDSTQTPEQGQTSAAEDKAPVAQAQAAEKPADPAPVEYKFEAPEGVTLDQEALAKFTDLAKEAKLTPELAQKLVNLQVQREQQRAQAFADQVKAWGDEVKADKNIGTPEALAVAQKAVALGPPELRGLLESTGLGSHPTVVKWAYAVGKALSEDTIHRGQGAPRDADPAKRMFPNMN